MPTHTESNACIPCARSKRKCGREMPACTRCTVSGRSCVYPRPSRNKAIPPSRPLLLKASNNVAPPMGDEQPFVTTDNTFLGAANSNLSDDMLLDITFPLLDGELTTIPLSPFEPNNSTTARTDWFLAPETWTISHHFIDSCNTPADVPAIKEYVAVVQSWFEQWVSTGSNPFIHPRLYSGKFPACVQVAFSTLSNYIHRTPANADTVFRIIEDRSNDLLRENGAVQGSGSADEWVDAEHDGNLFAQLTRLHALMVYQMIGLFDGDIRSRHVAEGHMAVHDSWAGKLMRSAEKALSSAHAPGARCSEHLPMSFNDSQQQWYLWILSESIRRTWLVAVSFSAVFRVLQRRSGPCPGSVMYTNRAGLWDATSAAEWEKRCGGNVFFLQRFGCGTLLEETVPADIDEFGTAMLGMTFDRESLQRWRDRSGT